MTREWMVHQTQNLEADRFSDWVMYRHDYHDITVTHDAETDEWSALLRVSPVTTAFLDFTNGLLLPDRITKGLVEIIKSPSQHYRWSGFRKYD